LENRDDDSTEAYGWGSESVNQVNRDGPEAVHSGRSPANDDCIRFQRYEFIDLEPYTLNYPDPDVYTSCSNLGRKEAHKNNSIALDSVIKSEEGLAKLGASINTDLDLDIGLLYNMDEVFKLCRDDRWNEILKRLRRQPALATSHITMDNHIQTTILHQAITSKGDVAIRSNVIMFILDNTPRAAAMKNGYGSLPLHVIAQRNTRIDSQTKERLIFALVDAYPDALTEPGGVGKRTPLHIIFTGKPF
jgi:hypothetical protein